MNNGFVWIDGWPIRYTNWISSPVEPNNECAIMTSSGKWEAIPCANTSGYVCKFTEGKTQPTN